MTYNEINTDIIDYILELFRIEPKDKISSLSTGQKKALRFALTISRTTSVYIMDEPFANIDIDTRTKFKKLIFDYIDIENSLIIVSSHDMDSLLDEIILINESQFLASENVENIKSSTSESLAEWYITQIGK